MVAKMFMHHSAIWKRLVKIRDMADQHIYWTLGNGFMSFWYDIWVGSFPLFSLAPNRDTKDRIKDFWLEGKWNLNALSSKLPEVLVLSIIDQFFDETVQDIPCWKPSPNGLFSLSSAWDVSRKKDQKIICLVAYGATVLHLLFPFSVGNFLGDGYLWMK